MLFYREWIDSRLTNPRENKGLFDVTVTDVPNWNYYLISGKDDYTTSSSRYYHPEENTTNFTIYDTEINNINGGNFILSMIDENKDLKYFEIVDPQNNSTIALSGDNLLDFDSYIDVELPSYDQFSFSVKAYEENQSYLENTISLNSIYEYSFPDKMQNVKIGYLSRYSKFKTSYSITEGSYKYNVDYYGPKPNSITIPEKQNVTIIDSSFIDYKFETNFDYTRTVNVWQSTPDFSDPKYNLTTWVVYADENNKNVQHLPEEIFSIYPELDIEGLKFSDSNIYIQSEDTKDYLNRVRNNLTIPNNFTEEYITIRK